MEPSLQGHQLLWRGEVIDARLLHRKADAPAHLDRVTDDVEAGHAGMPARWPDQGAEHPDRGRLAGAVRAEYSERLAGPNAQRDAAHRFGAVGIGLGQVVEHDRVAGSAPGRNALGARDTDQLVQGVARSARSE